MARDNDPCEEHTLEAKGKPLQCDHPSCRCFWKQCLMCATAIVEIDCPNDKHREILEREARKLQRRRLE